MARILISEPRDDVRQLLKRMVSSLGHQPLLATTPASRHLREVDVLVIEPAAPLGAVLARAARITTPSLPLICASVTVPAPNLAEFGVVFSATLIKPFTTVELGDAIDKALRARETHDDDHSA